MKKLKCWKIRIILFSILFCISCEENPNNTVVDKMKHYAEIRKVSNCLHRYIVSHPYRFKLSHPTERY